MYKTIGTILLILFLVAITFTVTYYFFPRTDVRIETEVEVHTERDTLRDTLWRQAPRPEKEVLTDTFYLPADTAEIIERYKVLWEEHYVKRHYSEFFDLDTLGGIEVQAVVYRNKLDSVGIFPSLIIPTHYVTITNTVTPKNSWFLGGTISKTGVGVGIGYMRNTKTLYQLQYKPMEKTIEGGIYINLNRLRND